MRRLSRHLFTLCSAVSLLLFVATCVLWVRSHATSDLVHLDGGDRWISVATCRGTLATVGWLKADHDPGFSPRYRTLPPEELAWIGPSHRDRAATRVGGFGLWYLADIGGTTPSARELYVPLWLVAVAAVLPLARARRGVRHHLRSRRGGCPSCGYDLRASPGRCPECSTAPVATS